MWHSGRWHCSPITCALRLLAGSVSPGVTARCYIAVCLAELGEITAGRGVGEDAVRLAEEVEHAYSMAVALWYVGMLSPPPERRSRGPSLGSNGAWHSARAPPSRCTSRCSPPPLGAAYALAGRAEEAHPLLDQTLEHVATGSRFYHHALRAHRAVRGAAAREPCGGRGHPRRATSSLSPVPTPDAAIKRTPIGSSVRSPGIASLRTSTRPSPTTARPSSWPRSWACARSWRTATAASAPSMPRLASASRLTLSSLPPSTSIGPWT